MNRAYMNHASQPVMKRRAAAAVLCAAMLFVLLFSSFYIVIESHHECTGEDCPVCSCIQLCEHTIRQMGTGTAMEFLSVVVFSFAIYVLSGFISYLSCNTLITQKVRLNH